MDKEREILLKVLQAVLNEMKKDVSYENIRKLQHDLSNKYPLLYSLIITPDFRIYYEEEIKKRDIVVFIRYLWIYSLIFTNKNLISKIEKIIKVISKDIVEKTPKKGELYLIFSSVSRNAQMAKIIELTFDRIFLKSGDSIANYALMRRIINDKNPIFRIVRFEEEKIKINIVSESLLIDLFSRLLAISLEVYEKNIGRKNSYIAVFSSLKEIFEILDKVVDSFDLKDRLLNGVFRGYISPEIYGFETNVGKIPENSKIQIVSKGKVKSIMMEDIVKDMVGRYGGVIIIGKNNIEMRNVVNINIGEREGIEIKKVSDGNYVNIITRVENLEESIGKAKRMIDYYPLKCVISESPKYLNGFEDYTKIYVGEHETEGFDYTFSFKEKIVDIKIRGEKKRLYYEIKERKIRFIKKREVVEMPVEFINPLERVKSGISRNYGYSLKAKDYLLFIRVPCSDIMDIEEKDILNIRKKLNIPNLENKVYSVYIMADNSYVEIEISTFLEIIKYKNLSLLRRIYGGIGAAGKRDKNIRRMLDAISEEFSRKRRGISRSSSGGSYVYTVGGRGKVVKYRPLMEGEEAVDIAVFPTIRAAAIRSGGIVGKGNLLLDIRREDIRQNVRRSRTETLLCIIIEAGGYKYIEEKKRIIKHLMVSILKDAYERRDEVALIAMNGDKAKLVCDFTTDVEYVGEYVDRLEYGGLVPFTSGIMNGIIALKKKIGDRPSATPIMVVFTSGLANVPLVPGGYVNIEIEKIAKIIRKEDIPLVLIDISGRGSSFVRKFAMLTGGRYYHPQIAIYFV